jgi:hypothetical protein
VGRRPPADESRASHPSSPPPAPASLPEAGLCDVVALQRPRDEDDVRALLAEGARRRLEGRVVRRRSGEAVVAFRLRGAALQRRGLWYEVEPPEWTGLRPELRVLRGGPDAPAEAAV